MAISDTPVSSADPFEDLVKNAALLIIPDLQHGELYTTAQLCVAVWDFLDKSEHLRAGRVVSFLEATGQLPLRAGQKTSSNWKRYRRQ